MQDYKDTICHKVLEAQKIVRQAIESEYFDAAAISKLLTAIQSDANKMEQALKINKRLREKYNIDPEFRQLMQEKFTPPGINKMEKIDVKTPKKLKFELTLKDENGEVIYQNNIGAFIMCAVEKIVDIDHEGTIDGEVQTLAVGSDLGVWYAFDQLQQKFAGKFMELFVKLKNMIDTGALRDGTLREKLIHDINA